MNLELVTIVRDIAIAGISAFLTWLLTRKKTDAETKEITAKAASEEVETTNKVTDLIRDMRTENVELNRKNIELEKQNTDFARTIEILRSQLETGNKQLERAQKQLDLLRGLAEESPIIETLQTQMQVVRDVINILQTALNDGGKLLIDKEKKMQELLRTTSDIEITSRKTLK